MPPQTRQVIIATSKPTASLSAPAAAKATGITVVVEKNALPSGKPMASSKHMMKLLDLRFCVATDISKTNQQTKSRVASDPA
jgi:hypothetical protein